MSSKNFLSYFFWIIIGFLVGFSLPWGFIKIIYSPDVIKETSSIIFSLIPLKKDISSVVYQREYPHKEIIVNEEKETSLVFVGDIMLCRGVERSVNKNFNGNFLSLFEGLDFIKNADVSFGNLEGPVSLKGKNLGNLYSFRMNPLVIDSLKEAGFDVLSIANNHIGDWGEEAFKDTILNLKNKNIEPCGESTEPVIIEKNNLKVGFLCFSDVGPNWLKINDRNPGILIVDDSFKDVIKSASLKVDFLIVSLHFGEEYKKDHNKRQEYLSHLAIDNGAKLVIGHHPHVVEDIEIYNNGLIAYSLGNFIFDQYFSKETMRGMALEIILSNDGTIKSFDKKNIKLNKFYKPDLETSSF